MTENEKNDGGPAFPSPGYEVPEHATPYNWASGEIGMTLRDYFAAHAPVEVPSWFEFKVQSLPAAPKPFDAPEWGFTSLEMNVAKQWQFSGGEHDINSFAEAHQKGGGIDFYKLNNFERAWNAYWENRKRIQFENHAASVAQWRWAYADIMIAGR